MPGLPVHHQLLELTQTHVHRHYCISFAKYQNESTTGIPVFPILNPPPSSLPYPPSGSSQCTSPKHTVSCIEPGLATHFIHDIIHVSMPFSQIFPPSPSPTESIRLFYTSVSPIHQCLFCCLVRHLNLKNLTTSLQLIAQAVLCFLLVWEIHMIHRHALNLTAGLPEKLQLQTSKLWCILLSLYK